MTTKALKHKTDALALRDALQRLDPVTYQSIRDSYYKAVEGMQTLADELERAGDGVNSVALMAEHINACGAIAIMAKSSLGAIV